MLNFNWNKLHKLFSCSSQNREGPAARPLRRTCSSSIKPDESESNVAYYAEFCHNTSLNMLSRLAFHGSGSRKSKAWHTLAQFKLDATAFCNMKQSIVHDLLQSYY